MSTPLVVPVKHEVPFGSRGPAGTANNTHHIPGMRGHLVAFAAEFVGTVLFLWFAFAAHLMAVDEAFEYTDFSGRRSSQIIVHVALAYGISFLVTSWAFYRIAGGLFNPAITIGMMIGGVVSMMRGGLFILAQILGAMAAAGLVECMFPGPIEAVNTVLGPNTSIARGVFIEMFLTILVVFTALMLSGERAGHTVVAPIGIGLSLFIATLAGYFYTGASVNPARSFGASVAAADFPGHHWIYWVGPLLGAAIAGGFYRLMRAIHEKDDKYADNANGAGHGYSHA